MRLRTALSLASLFVLLFTLSVWASPVPSMADARSNQTATGKISAVDGTALSLDVQNQTMQFQLDENTKVQGKLEVGSVCTVEYRVDGGKNVAVNVTVQARPGQ
ncbi:MAG TPA: hypothetical protein VEH49_01050 [Methylomirabilota bacterium]|nr:hypothetical protein [Methylomirabilota bacterium]